MQKRNEAHITINFVAYKVYKELERQLKLKNARISCEQAIEIAKSIYAVEFTDPINDNTYKETLLLSKEQNQLANLFEF